MAVPIALGVNRVSVDVGNPVPLFHVTPGSNFAVAPEGQRFLVSSPTEEAAASPITIVLNWKPKE